MEITIIIVDELDIANSVIRSISNKDPLVVECDASDYALAALLSQNERSMPFSQKASQIVEKSPVH